MRRTFLAGAIAAATVGVLTLGAQSAAAATICNGCNYLSPATYLGAHDASTNDLSTFQHIFSEGEGFGVRGLLGVRHCSLGERFGLGGLHDDDRHRRVRGNAVR